MLTYSFFYSLLIVAYHQNIMYLENRNLLVLVFDYIMFVEKISYLRYCANLCCIVSHEIK